MQFDREFQLRRPVCLWLDGLGYTPLMECHSMGNCDIVGVRFGDKVLMEIVCVELKLRDVRGVLRQCDSHLDRSHLTYAAMPLDVATKALAKFLGTPHGLIGVSDRLEVLRPPVFHLPTFAACGRIRYASAKRRSGEWRERIKNEHMLRYYRPPADDL